ncbi:MmpS family transport accessory protein [Gordonia sp. 'Campus']|uniref:MmpS family transport accessory protein n=1 Tax=Gordonia sp. 'Campus' TaxID=2915824 RepID=UPI001EE4D3CA|nr:MmpS family transport accessory protein [Gordonia sp. 'Campus']
MKKSDARGRSWWIVLVVIAVMAVSAFYVGKLRLSEIPDRAIGHSPAVPQAGAVRDKSIEYEVTGQAGASARVSYIEPGGRVVDDRVSVPWRVVLRTRELTTSAGVLTQSSGGAVSCAVRVNGFERARQAGSGTGGSTVANCLVPVA